MNRPARALVPLLFFAGACYFFYLIRGVLLPFVLAAVFAYLLNPAVSFFEGRGFRRLTVVVLLYIVVLASLTAGAFAGASALSREAAQAKAGLPAFVRRSRNFFKLVNDARSGKKTEVTPAVRALRRLEEIPGSDDVLDYVGDNWQAWAGSALEKAPSVAWGVIPAAEFVFLVPFIGFFFLAEGPAIVDGFLDVVPSRYVETLLGLIVGVEKALGGYLRGLFLEALLVGLAAWVGLRWVGLEYAVQVALAVGVTTLIPYVGPVVGVVLGGALAVYQWGSLAGLFKVGLVCVGVKFLDDWFLQPTILQDTVDLHPVFVLFSLLAGGTLWGFWGLLFAVPAACVVKVGLEVGWDWYRSEFGVRPPTLPADAHVPLI